MEIILNPKYRFLHDFLEHIEEHFATGEIVQQSFNEIRLLRVDELTLSVKRYGHSLRGRLKFYKMAKGKRAFIGQRLLRERGYDSPEPVAFVRFRRRMLTERTYFVTIRSSLQHSFDDVSMLSAKEQTELVKALAAYTKRMHEDGFIHHNYKSKHILFDRNEEKSGWRFALLDVNRVHRHRKPIGINRGLKNFARIVFQDEALFLCLIDEYAHLRGIDTDYARKTVLAAHTAYQEKIAHRGR